MTNITMRHDFRTPMDGSSSQAEIYDAAMAQFRWADQHGFDFAVVSEHHGFGDGWIPAPITAAAAIAGATERIKILISALLVPLHDPIRLAEQLAVLDHLSGGRVWTVAGAGYRAEEFAMADVPMTRRGATLESHLEVMLQAWTGEPFEYKGREVVVTPRPRTGRHPNVLVGGGVEVAARRAARLRLPMMPMHGDPKLVEYYEDEAEKVGFEDGFVLRPSGPTFVHVTYDVDQTWSEIGRYVFEEAQTYERMQTPGQHSNAVIHADTIADLKHADNVLVGPPEEIIEAARALAPGGALTFNPLAGGLPPKLAWESLELFAAEVLPALQPSDGQRQN